MNNLSIVLLILLITVLLSISTCEELYPPYSQLDLVVVFDTTGSMVAFIRQLQQGFRTLSDSIESWGLDVKYGLVTYGDSCRFPLGTNLTDSADLFFEKIESLWCTGGSDAPENALDALMAARGNFDWRDTSLKVIFIFTDAVFCMRTSTCENCRSMWLYDEVLDSLKSSRIVVFSTIRMPLWSDFCTGMREYNVLLKYKALARGTGGHTHKINSPALFDSLISELHYILINRVSENIGQPNIGFSAFPNPFNKSCLISVTTQLSDAELEIYYPDGKIVFKKKLSQGKHEIEFDAENLPSGVYIAVLRAGEFSLKKSLILIK
ncbi:MAG TPA: T9SS type A sorting domain-containing protein [candidate division Zixibacteria bacterium]|nr:T9SS type A sorting domain-containing protein [candidate division Zixibacteria bacterium]